MNLTKSTKSNLVTTDFQKIDPTVFLNKDCLDIFYETVHEIEIHGNVTAKEWNQLISYIQQLDSQVGMISIHEIHNLSVNI